MTKCCSHIICHGQMVTVLCIVQCNENESVFTDQFSRGPIPGHVSAGAANGVACLVARVALCAGWWCARLPY